MTNDQINRAIAEACNWNGRPVVHTDGKGSAWVREYPDYCTDLNAMHEAEKGLGNRLREYGERLCEMTVVSEHDFPACYIWHATAHQRAEAFLRVLGKWATAEESSVDGEEVQK